MKILAILLAFAVVTHALYDGNSAVELLTDSSFSSKVLKSDEVWLVEFFAPWCGHCKNLVPEWEKAAKALKGIARVAGVDATQHQSLASQFQVQGFPTILIFGADKKSPQKYESARSADAITEAALKAARETVKARLSGKKSSSGSSSSSKGGDKKKSGGASDVVELTADNFKDLVLGSSEPWLVEFFAPWCGHCKNLAPEWEKAATELKGFVKLGAVDATVHSALAGTYDVRGYPTIKFFAPGSTEPQDYNGGRTSNAIVEWALAKAEQFGVAPEIVEITNEAQMQSECYSKKVCVVTLVPHVIDTGAKGRLELLDTIKNVVKRVRGKGMAFVWMQGGAQEAFEQTFSLNAGYPALVAISHAKQRAAIHRNAFTVDAIVRTLNSPASTPFKNLSPLVDVPAWDGKDFVPPAEEEL